MSLWTTPKLQKSPFLRVLPPEIRVQIYTYALTSTLPTVTFALDPYQRPSYIEATQPALTRVSRQLRAESLPVFYGCNAFVLHTEGDKAEDAGRWLTCNAAWLCEMRRLELWVRYVTGTLGAAAVRGLQGAMGGISVSLVRRVKGGKWEVDGWRWITVVRKPDGLDEDGEFLVRRLGAYVNRISGNDTRPNEYLELGKDLRAVYVEEKTMS